MTLRWTFIARIMVLSSFQLYFQSFIWAGVTTEQAAKETYVSNIVLITDNELISRIKSYGVNITFVKEDTQPGGGKYFCGGMSTANAHKASGSVIQALERLPARSIQQLNLKYILLCSSVKTNHQDIGGIPVPPIKLLMINATNGRSDEYLQRTLLHELYHFSEFVTGSYNDASWDNLFGSGYDNRYESSANQTHWGSGGKGFINSYAKTFPHEERAEIFAIGVMDGNKIIRFAQKNKDTLLEKKINYMKKKVRKVFDMPFP